MPGLLSFQVTSEGAGQTLTAVLRQQLAGQSWSQVRRLIAGRRARLNGESCQDPARRVKAGDQVELLAHPERLSPLVEDLSVRHVDAYLVVVEKPAGIPTVRHPLERDWSERRKQLTPTVEDLVQRQLRDGPSRLRIVHRLDKETSGLVVFARTALAERGLGRQFHAHTVTRRYLAVIPGFLPGQTISSRLVRDRGDGRRGSTDLPGLGKEAVTHVEVVERVPGYTLLGCRLETGRTHQIRIHLAEAGHPVCGEKVYCIRRDGSVVADQSQAPRLALHAAELGFVHPITGQSLHWSMPLPADLEAFVQRLRCQADSHAN
jgi:23S rRNA pseudouridine1911/1915/1917 synthase